MLKMITPHPLTLGLIAALSGLILGLAALSAGYLLEWRKPWAIAGLALLVGGGLTWLSLVRWWQRLVETLHGIQPAPMQPEPLRLEILARDGAYLEGDFIDLPNFTRDQIIDISDLLMTGGSFSHASLAGSGKILSRSEYELLRDLWISRGLVRWTSERAHFQGLTLTAKGRAVVRGYANMSSAPLPRLVDRNLGGR